ncbi:MAG TPA: hypothetical protein DEB40_10035 [Elusimicrobia bacterium]|nr:hypothetical protein [Elusimicrobiota bacterium]
MLEDALTAPLRAGTVFGALAERPAPGYDVMIPSLLVFCASAFAADFMRSAYAFPTLVRFSPAGLALTAAATLAITVPASFVAAGLLHAFMLLAGGTGDFKRSYQACALLSIAMPLQAMLGWFDTAWILPALLAAYLAVEAARTLHRAPPARAAAVFGVLAALTLGGEWFARQQLARAALMLKEEPNIEQLAASTAEFNRQMQQLQGMSPSSKPATGPNPDSSPAQDPGLGNITPGDNPRTSGLDLLYAPGTGAGPETPRDVSIQAHAVEQTAANMMVPVLSMLNNPQLTKGMSPEQAQQTRELAAMVSQMQSTLSTGQRLTPQQQAAMTRKMQAMVLQLMSQMNDSKNAPARPRANISR